MKNWKSSTLVLTVLAVMWTAHAAHGQSPPTQTNSVKSSPNSDTRAESKQPADSGQQSVPPAVAGGLTREKVEPNRGNLVAACNGAVEELKASRIFIEALESETRAITDRLETEKRSVAILTELNDTRKSETDSLRSALAAKNETITAKDAVIASQDKLIAALKTKKPSPWRRIGDILIGAAAFAILK